MRGVNDALTFPTMPAALCGATPLAINGDALGALLTSWQVSAKIRQLDAPADGGDRLARTSHKYAIDANGNAVIPMDGIMLGEPDAFLDWLGVDYTVTPHLAEAITQADARADVKAIIIQADSPGGSVTGLQAAHDAIAAARKPVMVSASGLLCSAALYVAAAADSISADPTTIIGSIGTMMTLTDVSGMVAKLGIQVHLIASGPQKGTGTPGVPVTDERKRPLQAVVDALAAQFKAAVATGRGLSAAAVDAIATGEAWIASRAAELGLIDRISTNPLAAAGTTAKEANMLTKDQFKALLAAHPDHTALIISLDEAGKDDADVKAAIVDAQHQAVAARIPVLEGELVKAKAGAAAALKVEQDAHAATQTKLAALEAANAKLKAGIPAHDDPGAENNPDANAPKTKTTAELADMTPSAKALFFQAGGKQVDK